MDCQTKPVLSDGVWDKTVSPKLVEEIDFAWAFQTDQFKNLTFCFFGFFPPKAKFRVKTIMHYVWGFFGAWQKK
jgi:hypothetical protein